jgi:hypothetical protein
MNSLLDTIYSRLANRDLFFKSGWGDKDGLRYIIENHPTNIHLRPVKEVELKITKEQREKNFIIKEGYFESPFEFKYEFGETKKRVELPDEAKRAYVQMILPFNYNFNTPSSSLCCYR